MLLGHIVMTSAFASWGVFTDLQYSLLLQFRTIHSACSSHLKIVLPDFVLAYPPLREMAFAAMKDFSQNHLLPQKSLHAIPAHTQSASPPAECMYSDRLWPFEITVYWSGKLESNLKLLSIVLPICADPSLLTIA